MWSIETMRDMLTTQDRLRGGGSKEERAGEKRDK